MKFLVKKAPEHFIRTVNDEISSILNRHFDSYFPEAAYIEECDKFAIPVEISETDNEYCVQAEIPGIKKDNIEVDIDKNSMTINAVKKEEKEHNEKGYKKTEFRYGDYSRTIYFPIEIDTESSKAKIEDGILKIHATKKYDEHAKKKLDIE